MTTMDGNGVDVLDIGWRRLAPVVELIDGLLHVIEQSLRLRTCCGIRGVAHGRQIQQLSLLRREITAAAQQERKARTVGMEGVIIIADLRMLLSLLDILMEAERGLEMIDSDVHLLGEHGQDTQQCPRNVAGGEQADPSRQGLGDLGDRAIRVLLKLRKHMDLMQGGVTGKLLLELFTERPPQRLPAIGGD